MVEKNVYGRIVQKHDIEANWKKAVNFIPKIAELIVYDIDDNYNYERFKIGDGKTLVNDLPFADEHIIDTLSYKEDINLEDVTTVEPFAGMSGTVSGNTLDASGARFIIDVQGYVKFSGSASGTATITVDDEHVVDVDEESQTYSFEGFVNNNIVVTCNFETFTFTEFSKKVYIKDAISNINADIDDVLTKIDTKLDSVIEKSVNLIGVTDTSADSEAVVTENKIQSYVYEAEFTINVTGNVHLSGILDCTMDSSISIDNKVIASIAGDFVGDSYKRFTFDGVVNSGIKWRCGSGYVRFDEFSIIEPVMNMINDKVDKAAVATYADELYDITLSDLPIKIDGSVSINENNINLGHGDSVVIPYDGYAELEMVCSNIYTDLTIIVNGVDLCSYNHSSSTSSHIVSYAGYISNGIYIHNSSPSASLTFNLFKGKHYENGVLSGYDKEKLDSIKRNNFNLGDYEEKISLKGIVDVEADAMVYVENITIEDDHMIHHGEGNIKYIIDIAGVDIDFIISANHLMMPGCNTTSVFVDDIELIPDTDDSGVYIFKYSGKISKNIVIETDYSGITFTKFSGRRYKYEIGLISAEQAKKIDEDYTKKEIDKLLGSKIDKYIETDVNLTGITEVDSDYGAGSISNKCINDPGPSYFIDITGNVRLHGHISTHDNCSMMIDGDTIVEFYAEVLGEETIKEFSFEGNIENGISGHCFNGKIEFDEFVLLNEVLNNKADRILASYSEPVQTSLLDLNFDLNVSESGQGSNITANGIVICDNSDQGSATIYVNGYVEFEARCYSEDTSPTLLVNGVDLCEYPHDWEYGTEHTIVYKGYIDNKGIYFAPNSPNASLTFNYFKLTTFTDGLMSGADKEKLDNTYSKEEVDGRTKLSVTDDGEGNVIISRNASYIPSDDNITVGKDYVDNAIQLAIYKSWEEAI